MVVHVCSVDAIMSILTCFGVCLVKVQVEDYDLCNHTFQHKVKAMKSCILV